MSIARLLPLILAVLHGAALALAVDHYELELRPDFEARVLHGHAALSVRVDGSPIDVVELASPNLSISRVQVDGRDVGFGRGDGAWRVALNASAAAGSTLRLDVDYSAPAADGLVFGESHVYTAFHTCAWMPCVGGNLGRASIGIGLELAKGYLSVASGRRLPDTGTTRQRWLESRPQSLYTFGFAAGRFTEVLDPRGDGRLRYLGAGQDEQALRSKFKESARVLAFFEDKAGVPLPNPVYTQVLVPGGVAQEVSSFSVIGTRMLDPILQDPQEDWVVAHEMAHQWWGNLVTCATWKEFWLNEGIAVFMTAAWKEARWGSEAYRRELSLARRRWQGAKDAGFDKPLSWPGEYPSASVMRAIHYSKGALFMDALRADLGESAFWAGLRRYTQAHAGRSVTAKDLQTAMEASAGRSLDTLFDAWVY